MIIGIVTQMFAEEPEIIIRKVKPGAISISIEGKTAEVSLETLGKELGILFDKKSIQALLKHIEQAA